MIKVCKNGLEAFQFTDKVFSGCIHGLFSRKGGLSTGQWASLYQGSNIGDLRDNVIENRKRTFNFYDRSVDSIFDVWQVHGNEIICTDNPRCLDEAHQKADAIFTNNPEITLFMRFADCVPILIYDPEKQVVGIVHAGWQGTVNNIVGHAIKTISVRYGIDPAALHAGIGPSIGPDHYIVGCDVIKQVKKNFGDNDSQKLLTIIGSNTHFDLWRANQLFLERAGVKFIERADICTACNLQDWYSHRAEKGLTGRFGALIALRDSTDD